MTPSSQAEIVSLATAYADESRAQKEKMTGWAFGLGVATVALIAAPVAPVVGVVAGALAILTGGYAFGHHRAEQMMREAAREAGNENFSDKLKSKAGEIAEKSGTAQKWGTIGMIGFAVAVVGSLLFPPAAPALELVRSVGSFLWGYNSLKSIFLDARDTHAANLSAKVQELEQKEFSPPPANDDGANFSLTNSSPGPAFGLAVKGQSRDDAPAQKSGSAPAIRL